MLQKSPIYPYIPASDIDRARQFYEHKLGFTPKQLGMPKHIASTLAVDDRIATLA